VVAVDGDSQHPDLAQLITYTVGLRPRRAAQLARKAAASGVTVDVRAVTEGLVSLEQGRRLREAALEEQALCGLLECSAAQIVLGPPVAMPSLGAGVALVHLLKKLARVARAMPSVRPRVPSVDAAYRRKPTALADLEKASTEGTPDDRAGAAERIVLLALDGKRPVSEVAMVTALGEYETRRALAWLVEHGHAELAKESAPATGRPLRRRTSRLSVPLGALAGLVGLGLLAYLSFALPSAPGPEEPVAHLLARVRHAVRAHALAEGRVPESLEQVAASRFATADSLVLRTRLVYHPAPAGDGFFLRPGAARVESGPADRRP
jgi:hypothetical protein